VRAWAGTVSISVMVQAAAVLARKRHTRVTGRLLLFA
jgi:hypothetical protein